MKHRIALAVLVSFLALPVHAQQGKDMEEGMDLLSQGARLFLRGLVQELGPALAEVEQALGNINAYHPPEVLPNGDIIIRRKQDMPAKPEPLGEGEIEL